MLISENECLRQDLKADQRQVSFLARFQLVLKRTKPTSSFWRRKQKLPSQTVFKWKLARKYHVEAFESSIYALCCESTFKRVQPSARTWACLAYAKPNRLSIKLCIFLKPKLIFFTKRIIWVIISLFANFKCNAKKYIFKHFAKSKKLFFCQYLSFSVWFPLSLKHWSSLTSTHRFVCIVVGEVKKG